MPATHKRSYSLLYIFILNGLYKRVMSALNLQAHRGQFLLHRFFLMIQEYV